MSSYTNRRVYLLCYFLLQWSSCYVWCFTSSGPKHISIRSRYDYNTRKATWKVQNGYHPSNKSFILAETKANTNPKQRAPFFIDGPSQDTKPNYDEIHGPLGPSLDKLFLTIFRTKMAEKVGIDSKLPKDDYQGVMELTGALNARYSEKEKVRYVAQSVLQSLFPSWLPGAFGVMFAKPFPEFSSRMNAWATWVAGTWLMGECEINDCEIDGGAIGQGQGLLVKRCRFLEESGCASLCVNSCKIPTQQFFNEDMKLPLTMTPDYETGECQFSFGLTPTKEEELGAMNTPCLARCPSSGGLRQWHSGSSSAVGNEASQTCQNMSGDE